MAEPLRITRLGHSGDGVVETPTGPIYVPFALPGETIHALREGRRATLVDIVAASQERVAPPCPHFGDCGGCALQHWHGDAYRRWKRDLVATAFELRGINAPVAELVGCSPASRRRAVLTAARRGREVTIGFNRADSHQLVAIPECLILKRDIVDRLDTIGRLIAPLVKPNQRPRVTVIACDNGLDVAISSAGRVSDRVLDALPGRVNDPAIARVTIDSETVFQDREPEMLAGTATLLPVPGGFVQAVAEAEQAMADAMLAGLRPARKVADLFAGIGTFTLRLAERASVLAVENDAASLASLALAARRANGLKQVEAMRRDLLAEPLGPSELKRFDAVVFDPPRAGAKAQAEKIAVSAVPRVVAISCNPATLARDARILIDGGYRLTGVTPIDQFLWSAHVEAVATFER